MNQEAVKAMLTELAHNVRKATVDFCALVAEAHGAKEVAQDIRKLACELSGVSQQNRNIDMVRNGSPPKETTDVGTGDLPKA